MYRATGTAIPPVWKTVLKSTETTTDEHDQGKLIVMQNK